MSEFVQLKAEDGAELSAYVARPAGAAKGAVVVVQEIFGINQHMQSVADDFAAEGYVAIAPALFDRIEKGVVLSYDGPANPQTLNRYAYVLNNPLSFVDPTGLYCAWEDGTSDDDPSDGGVDAANCRSGGGHWTD